MDVLQNSNWVLSVGTFLPLVGVIVMLFIPKAEEELHKLVALVTALATLGVGVYTLTQFDYDQAGKLQFFANAEWIKVISSNYTIGLDGMSLPLYFLSMVVTVLVMVYSWDRIPSPGNPKAFLILMLILQTGMAGTFYLAGPHLVLRVLRSGVVADVLHDRCLGWRESSVRIAQVLLVHDVRIGAHARCVHRTVLQSSRRTARWC